MLPNGRTDFPANYEHKRPSSPLWAKLNGPSAEQIEIAAAAMNNLLRQFGIKK